MELDGFNEELRVAFEYHGIQHFKEIRVFQGKTSFDKRQKLDEEKRVLCKRHNVTLIEVPHYVNHEEMEQFIRQEVESNGLTVPRLSPINLDDLDYYPKNRLKDMRTFAEAKGGECLASRYVTVVTPVRWRCREGHEWEATPDNVKNGGSWCPSCCAKWNPFKKGRRDKHINPIPLPASPLKGEELLGKRSTIQE